MHRDDMLHSLSGSKPWDILVIGGGATGLGCAVDAASRGYRTLLLEQEDFSKGTSSRSTKLIHGGVRYLQQGNISLVLDALKERGLLMKNAPHLVRNQSFIVPNYKWWEGPFYGIGLKVYDMMAGSLGLGPSSWLSREETLQRIPTLEPGGLRGGVVYQDGQFDDSRLAIDLAKTAVDHGGTVINYMKVVGLLKEKYLICGVQARDELAGRELILHSRVVVNATGVFNRSIRCMDQPNAPELVTPSQGIHLVLDREFLPGQSAIMVPHTSDGRVLFAVPWHGKVILGTTDTPVREPSLEPRARPEEVSFILNHISQYLSKHPSRGDVKSVFAGLRPLASSSTEKSTSSLSRDHQLTVSASGLLSITGGKWTTYRRMAQDTIDHCILIGGLESRPCQTQDLPIHGWTAGIDPEGALACYGSDLPEIKGLVSAQPELGELIHPRLPYLRVQVLWAVRQEMAMTLEDMLARRTRSLLLDAEASREAAPSVARQMALELKRDPSWELAQVEDYRQLAAGYCLDP